MRFSTTGFFPESVSSKPLSIPIGLFHILSKILGDVRRRCTTNVVDSGGKWKKSSIRKILILNYLVWAPLGSRVNIDIHFPFKGVRSLILFPLFTASVVDNDGAP